MTAWMRQKGVKEIRGRQSCGWDHPLRPHTAQEAVGMGHNGGITNSIIRLRVEGHWRGAAEGKERWASYMVLSMLPPMGRLLHVLSGNPQDKK